MIMPRHWLVAVMVAVFVHALLVLSLLPQHRKNLSPTGVEQGGFEVGLSGEEAGELLNILADEMPASAEKMPAEPVSPPAPRPVLKVMPQPASVEKPALAEVKVAPEAEQQNDQPLEQQVAVQTFPQPVSDSAVVVANVPQPELPAVIETQAVDEVPVDVQASGDNARVTTTQNVTNEKEKSGKPGHKGLRSSAGGSGRGDGRALRGYFGEVAALIDANKDYPGEVKKEKQEGTVIVAFSINRKGELLSAGIRKSSGYAMLDKAALATLQRSSPFPPIPKTINQDTLKIAVPIDYTLITR